MNFAGEASLSSLKTAPSLMRPEPCGIGLNWSSLDDLNARAFEIPAMKLYPVMYGVPDMPKFEFTRHAWTFGNMDKAIEGVMWAKDNPDKAQEIAEQAYQAVQGQTYDVRIQQLLEECGFS